MEKTKLIESAVLRSSKIYVDELREKIDNFSEQTFSISNAWDVNKKAFGKDMIRAPANALWTPVHFAATGIGKGLKKLEMKALDGTCDALTTLPVGFVTDTEREIEWRIYSQFLKIPFKQGDRESSENRLMEIILEQEEIKTLMAESMESIAELGMTQSGRDTITERMLEYVDSRKAAAEVSATLIGAAASFVGAKSVNLGAISLGQTLASSAAYHSAISSFALGNTLGGVFYSVVPVSASTGAIIISTGGVAAILGVISAFGGVLTDPIQHKFGMHQKKLNLLVDSIESQLLSNKKENMNLKDGYVARVMDMIDLVATIAAKHH